jgi:hypothetical protein
MVIKSKILRIISSTETIARILIISMTYRGSAKINKNIKNLVDYH